MDLIIGGAYQGKCTFAAEKYRLTAADICDLAADAPAPARCYVHLEALTQRGQAAEALPLLLAAEAAGVVPLRPGIGRRVFVQGRQGLRQGRNIRRAVVQVPAAAVGLPVAQKGQLHFNSSVNPQNTRYT